MKQFIANTQIERVRVREYFDKAGDALVMLDTKKVLQCDHSSALKLWQRRALAHTQSRMGLANWQTAKLLQDYPQGYKIEEDLEVSTHPYHPILPPYLTGLHKFVMLSGAGGAEGIHEEAS